ncbi:hypothetical protein [Mesorhizobium sp. KR9-304]|uniref:hypothetical protein n=1 Tax=Mesorhizobium sp. KR9-304 TaxID=3156614 RepID=UPI0032B467C9
MLKRKVKEAFYFAADGRNARLLKAGREYPFTPEQAARFEREGYIASELPPMVAGRFSGLPVAKAKRKRK